MPMKENAHQLLLTDWKMTAKWNPTTQKYFKISVRYLYNILIDHEKVYRRDETIQTDLSICHLRTK
jgi:hypothetical protein